jgi:antitoxin ParD1/3/4
MTISLTPELDAFVRHEVESGRYASSSEVIRAGLRLLQDLERDQQAKRDALRAWVADALSDGGEPSLSETEVMERLRARLTRGGSRDFAGAPGDLS